MKMFLIRFVQDRSGTTAIEYGLIAGLIFLAIIGGLTLFTDSSDGLLTRTMGSVSDGLAGPPEPDAPE